MTIETRASLAEFEGFVRPPNTHRPWPLFVLNDEYEPGTGEARLTELLESLARVGYGGVFLHPRPGLITEYLSPRWFEVIRHCIAECRRLGLVPALYDENSYPSGFAGGHVPALAPETSGKYVIPRFGSLPTPPPGNALALYRMEEGVPIEYVKAANLSAGASWCAFVLEKMHTSPWHGEFSYTSLLDPKTTKVFLETTYDRYRKELSDEDWNSCAAIFTDEPHLPTDLGGPWGKGLHFSKLVQSEFLVRKGYPLEPVMADLYYDSATSAATRFDFYETTHALWLENFAIPMRDWCRDQDIPFTGHYLEHDWPCPYATPGHVHLLAYMDWPGTDLLECFLLDGHDFQDPQNLDPSPAGSDPHALYFLKQVQSVANQLNKERVMNETWGAGGHDSTPVDWLRIGRFLAVHGVNLFVPHYSTTTIRGGRKNDNPQYFSEQSSCFGLLGPLNDELARLSWIGSRGRTRQRVLLIDPLTTGYVISAKSDCLKFVMTNDSLIEQISMLAATQDSVRPLRRDAAGFAQMLSDAQIDFDIGDEYILAESASVNGSAFQVGSQSYDLIVLPPRLQNLRSSTLELLFEFAQQGGQIVGARPALAWIDGRVDDWPDRLPISWYDSTEKLFSEIHRLVPPRLTFDLPLPIGVAHLRRECEDGIYYVIVNSSPVSWSGAVTIAEGSATYLLDPQTGEISPARASFTLPPREATILFIDGASSSPAPACESVSSSDSNHGSPLEFLGASAQEANVLVLDFCALEIGRESFPPQLVYECNRIYWDKHGLETNGWATLIQYRDQLLAANARMHPDSGGVVRFTFTILPGTMLSTIDLAFECVDQWRVRVNGIDLETDGLPTWLDYRISRAPIGNLLVEGENVVELITCPFDVRQEIDQIYLLGDFVVEPAGIGFVLGPVTAPLVLGSWKAQGLPFYDRKVSYQFKRPPGAGRVYLDASSWHGAAIEIVHGTSRSQTYGPILDLAFADSDPLEFSLIVTGLPCNLLGPWHKSSLIAKHGWSSFWHGEDVPNAPQPGRNYHQLDLGLFKQPVWIPGRVQ